MKRKNDIINSKPLDTSQMSKGQKYFGDFSQSLKKKRIFINQHNWKPQDLYKLVEVAIKYRDRYKITSDKMVNAILKEIKDGLLESKYK